MSLPWVVVTDPLESQDILLRRTKEFDRSSFFGEVIGGILPKQHIQFLSNDARFKDNRNLINHLMAPSFINEVSLPEVYKSVSSLMKVWQVKCDMAQGRPFSAHHDITYGALDSIFASSFGLAEADSITIQRFEAVSRWTPEMPDDADTPVVFPDGEIPEVFGAVLDLAESVKYGQLSPSPRLVSWVLRKFPYMRKAAAIKNKFINDSIDEAVQSIETGDEHPRNALYSVLLRERDVAAKQGRPPVYRNGGISDEFAGFLMAGHDTSATAVAWGVKFLADNPAAQDRLRDDLRAAIPQAVQEKRAPTYQELIKASVPYLDAVVDEVLRHANAVAFVVRVALQDTTVLGCRIPKGTDVFLMANGPGYLEPNMHIDDGTRSPGARQHSSKSLSGFWDDSNISAFRPERWLTTDPETGKEIYDPMAGPTLPFGLGPRGCFGRKLAVATLRLQFAMTVWHFHLLKTPDELNSYDSVQKFAREPTQCYTSGGNPSAGENCDEYPFASTSDADKGGQVNKCVISKHNSRQGNIISQYITNTCGGQNCQFIVGFGNPASPGVKYCQAYNDRYNQCTPDGTIFKNGKPDVRPPPAKRDGNSTQVGGLYLMKSGIKVAFGANLEIGTQTKHATPKNATMLAFVDDNDDDEGLVEWDFLDDEIVEKLE
ncbi:Cytochrome p450 [Lasiodiplodia theobromae]|uniref:Cytochrome p450 n=1 Tax=Lasiodiplodia theobromae TaxID=45133 RepID=UPI0015C3B195|nr:Cytochrome p450 [Lasiodiplodia theobromae]KAF4540343.1 Cytochrome p450 [Lasiodiplodia theobromae]